MNVTPCPASTALFTDSWSPSSSRTSRSRRRVPACAELVLDHLTDARTLLHDDQPLAAQIVERDVLPGKPVPGRADEDDLVPKERLVGDRAVARA